MDLEFEKTSVVQNIAGEHHKVVGGNIIYGDAHFPGPSHTRFLDHQQMYVLWDFLQAQAGQSSNVAGNENFN